MFYNKVKDFYDKGLWTKKMVKDAVIAKQLSEVEYKQITGEDYQPAI